MRREFFIKPVKVLFATLLVGVMGLSFAAPVSLPPAWHGLYDSGVEYYRNGDYDKAFKCFKQLSKEAPASQETFYYYAITLAQLGRFKEAKKFYEEVVRLEPDTEAAGLARQGIEYLPVADQLDSPPQFQKQMIAKPSVTEKNVSEKSAANRDATLQEQPQEQTATTNNNPFGMDPKAMEMMLLMSSMGNGGGGGSFNPMMYSVMQNFMRKNTAPGESGADTNMLSPDIMSSMMMNQMMQDFSPFGSDKND